MQNVEKILKCKFDAIVCGSGPACAVTAVELAKKGLQTLVIEVNDTGSGALEDVASNIAVSGERSPLFNFSRELGGSSNLWSGRTSFFEEIDFILNKWPIKYSDLEDDLLEAQEILGILPVDLMSEYKKLSSSSLGKLSKKPFSLKSFVMQHHFEPFNAGKYLNDNKCNELSIVEDVFVRRVFENGQGDINGLEARCLNSGKIFVLKANNYIIATGGLDVPRILLESELPSFSGEEALGKFVSTHPKLFVGSLNLKKKINANNVILSDQKVGQQYVRLGLGLDADYIMANGLLNHYIQLSPAFESYTESTLEFFRDRSALVSWLYGLGGFWRKLLEKLGRIIFMITQRISGKFGYYSRFRLKLHCDQFPDESNHISISKDTNLNGDKKIDIKWNFSLRDRDNARKFLLAIKKNVENSGIGTIDLDKEIFTEDWPLIGMHSHFMGATRMGDNPNKSVTDSYGRVNGIKNLYIAGPSLFAGYGYTNPMLPIVTFALRTSKEILRNQP